MSDFITCENKDLYSWEALIKQTIGQDADGEFYWKVKAVLSDDYYFFDDFEQVASGGIDSANLPDPQSLQDFRWDASVTNFTVLLVEQADSGGLYWNTVSGDEDFNNVLDRLDALEAE